MSTNGWLARLYSIVGKSYPPPPHTHTRLTTEKSREKIDPRTSKHKRNSLHEGVTRTKNKFLVSGKLDWPSTLGSAWKLGGMTDNFWVWVKFATLWGYQVLLQSGLDIHIYYVWSIVQWEGGLYAAEQEAKMQRGQHRQLYSHLWQAWNGWGGAGLNIKVTENWHW